MHKNGAWHRFYRFYLFFLFNKKTAPEGGFFMGLF
jgi:hypothetical protein